MKETRRITGGQFTLFRPTVKPLPDAEIDVFVILEWHWEDGIDGSLMGGTWCLDNISAQDAVGDEIALTEREQDEAIALYSAQ